MPFSVFADLLLLAGGRSLRLCLVNLFLCPLPSLFTDLEEEEKNQVSLFAQAACLLPDCSDLHVYYDGLWHER